MRMQFGGQVSAISQASANRDWSSHRLTSANEPNAARVMHTERNRPLTLDERRELTAGYEKLATMLASPARQAQPEERAHIEQLRTAAQQGLSSGQAKVAEFEEINRNYQNEDPGMDSIIRKGTLIDAELRHEAYASKAMSPDQIKEIAAKDLEGYSFLQGKPEQQKLAVLMGGMMGEPDYRSAIYENPALDLDTSIAAATSIESQAEMTTTHDKTRDQGMEL
ncbi:hypothetical protein EGJ86_19100 [Pseudomonas sp. o96-267]|nr:MULTISPECIES: hypothetical protein [Pseudomonas]MDH0959124.1 hypothetical protein [Pseudomonas chengduensis]MDV5863568.1 hypothetical protein [Pseudomonas mendocina]RRV31682.1 hypothetical protein EGJ86_19100 [Pseudomonas sp. o96-267]